MPQVAAVSTAFLSNSEVIESESSVACAVLSASISRRGNPVFSAEDSGHYSTFCHAGITPMVSR